MLEASGVLASPLAFDTLPHHLRFKPTCFLQTRNLESCDNGIWWGEGGGEMNWEIGIDTCTLLILWIK